MLHITARRLRIAILTLPLAASCGSGLNGIVEPRTLPPASAAPQVMSISDLGGAEIPAHGSLRVQFSDGAAVIGEPLWVQGTDLGREPSVSVAGRQVAVLARTGDGGLVVRVPPGTPTGMQPVRVSNEHGSGERSIFVRRYVMAVPSQGGALAWAELREDGPVAAGVTGVDADLLAVSQDGRAAYLSSSRAGRVTVVDLAAPGGPAVLRVIELGGEHAVALAAAADVLALVRDDDIVAVNVADPLYPRVGAAQHLPDVVHDDRVRSAALSPDGRLLAVVGAASNRLHLLELGAGGSAELVASATVGDGDPGQLREVTFAQDGRTIWVVAAEARHPRGDWVPVQVHAAHLRGEPGARFALELVYSAVAGAAADPISVCLARSGFTSESVAWLPPESTTLFLTAAVRDGRRFAVFRLEGDSAALELASSQSELGAPVVSSDGRWVLSGAHEQDGSFDLLAIAVQDAVPRVSRVRLASMSQMRAEQRAHASIRVGVQP